MCGKSSPTPPASGPRERVGCWDREKFGRRCGRWGKILMASKRWRCFFCDEVFTTRRDAWLHFGDTTDLPTCVDPLREDERARMNEVRELRDEVIRQQARGRHCRRHDARDKPWIANRNLCGRSSTSVR